MKEWALCILSIIISPLAFTQIMYSDSTWERWYEKQNYNESIPPFNHPIEHYDKGYIFHGRNEYPITPNKPILRKTDINGHLLWERKLDSTINKVVLSLKSYHDGGVIICGTSYHSNIGNPWVAKLNPCMEVEWCKIFEWTEYSSAIDIAEDQNGDIVVLTFGFGEFINERINLIKLSQNGDVLWKGDYATLEDYPYIWNASPYDLLISEDNHYYLATKADWPNNNDPGQGTGTRSLFIKVNSNGEEEWILPFGIYDTLYSKPWSLWELSNGNIIAIGDNYATENPVFMSFNSSGEEISFSTKQLMPEIYYGNRLANPKILNDSTFFGIWRYLYDITDNYHSGYMIFNSSLDIINYMEDDRWGGAANLIHTYNDKFVTVGVMKEDVYPDKNDIYLSKRNIDFSYDTVYSDWFGKYDSLCAGEIESGYISYAYDMIVGFDEIPAPQNHQNKQNKVNLKIYPNPAYNSEVDIEFEDADEFLELQMLIYDQIGEIIFQKKIHFTANREVLDVNDWSTGMYFLVLKNRSEIVGSAKLIVN